MTNTYLHIKTTSAPKLNPKSQGTITYAVLRNQESTEVFLILIANDGGGYFSRELIPFAKIQQCIIGVKPERPIPAKTFKAAFIGKSVNNACFLLAALRNEQLLKVAPDASQQHVLCGDWDAWRIAMLAEAGEPFELPDARKTPKAASADPAAIEADKVDDPASRKKSRKPSGGKREHPTGSSGEYGNANAS